MRRLTDGSVTRCVCGSWKVKHTNCKVCARIAQGKRTEAAEIVLEEWAHLSSFGLTVDEVAPRLGLKPASLDRALHRALEVGDERGRHKCTEEKHRKVAA